MLSEIRKINQLNTRSDTKLSETIAMTADNKIPTKRKMYELERFLIEAPPSIGPQQAEAEITQGAHRPRIPVESGFSGRWRAQIPEPSIPHCEMKQV
jgi:hypothetical protein